MPVQHHVDIPLALVGASRTDRVAAPHRVAVRVEQGQRDLLRRRDGPPAQAGTLDAHPAHPGGEVDNVDNADLVRSGSHGKPRYWSPRRPPLAIGALGPRGGALVPDGRADTALAAHDGGADTALAVPRRPRRYGFGGALTAR
ncbi:MAG: hypothetical protein LBQ06_07515 [Frankiaceae bacterium]|nr:hypothetical protein [Frankiaceae bacterium]